MPSQWSNRQKMYKSIRVLTLNFFFIQLSTYHLPLLTFKEESNSGLKYILYSQLTFLEDKMTNSSGRCWPFIIIIQSSPAKSTWQRIGGKCRVRNVVELVGDFYSENICLPKASQTLCNSIIVFGYCLTVISFYDYRHISQITMTIL